MRATYQIRKTEGRRPPLCVARAAIQSSCRRGHGTVHAPFSVRSPPSSRHGDVSGKKGVGAWLT